MNPLLDPMARLVIGHRGAAAEAPENTLPSIQAAVDVGVDAVEVDVHVSADGVPVVIHDATLERTTDGRGAVAALTFAQIQQARATRRGAAGSARVPSLAQLLEAFPSLPVLIELKTPVAQEPVARVLRAHAAARRCVLAAFDRASLRLFPAPEWARAASSAEARWAFLRAWAGLSLGAPAYRMLSVPPSYHGIPVATEALFEAARRAGLPVHVWTINDPEYAAALWRRGAAGIITDDPRRLTGGDG